MNWWKEMDKPKEILDYESAKWWLERSEKGDFPVIYQNNEAVKDLLDKAKLVVGLHESELKGVKD